MFDSFELDSAVRVRHIAASTGSPVARCQREQGMATMPPLSEYTNSGHPMPEGGDPLRGVALLAVERVGLRLSAWHQAREVAVAHSSGNVQRWLCACETRWGRSPLGRGASTSDFRPRSAGPTTGWGMSPADVAAELTPVLKRARVVAAEAEAVAWWLTTLYGHVGEPVPCRVVPLDELYRDLLPRNLLAEIERMKIVSHADHRAALLHPDVPHIVLEATRAIESLRQIAYRVEIGRAVVGAERPAHDP